MTRLSSRPFQTHFKAKFALIGLILLGSNTLAFDGKLKGIVFGFGLGAAPVSHLISSQLSIDVTKTGVAGEILAGYAWNNNDMLVYGGSGSIYSIKELGGTDIIQTVDALRWYHYWGSHKRRNFTMVGLGICRFATNYTNIDGDGFGYSVGVGREFVKQVQAGLYLSGGHTSNGYGVKANHFMLSILISVVAY